MLGYQLKKKDKDWNRIYTALQSNLIFRLLCQQSHECKSAGEKKKKVEKVKNNKEVERKEKCEWVKERQK